MKRFWDTFATWDKAEKAWDELAHKYRSVHPLKTPAHLPNTPSISKETRKFLKLKALSYLLKHDKERIFFRYFFKRPLKYAARYLKSLLKRNSYVRKGDLFLYGIDDLKSFQKKIAEPNSLLLVGFSYCHKPLECPVRRFNSRCLFIPDHPVCRQCFIGKVKNAVPEERTLPFIIPSIYDIGKKIFETLETHPQKKLLFLITACELSLEMFGDFGQMVGIQGVVVRLAGRVCNTLKAFDLAEQGIKPSLTLVSEEAKETILSLIRNFS